MMNDVRALCSISDPNLVQLIGAYHAPEKGQVRRQASRRSPFCCNLWRRCASQFSRIPRPLLRATQHQVALNSCVLRIAQCSSKLPAMPRSEIVFNKQLSPGREMVEDKDLDGREAYVVR